MNRSEIAEFVADRLQISRASADNAVKCVLEAIKDGLATTGNVTILEFGTFKVRHRKAWKYKQLWSGREGVIPASNFIVFKPSREIRDAVK